MDTTSIYKNSGEYAQKHGELELYLASCKANIACKDAIEAAISNHYGDNVLDSRSAVQDVVRQFGYERTLYVLAATLQQMKREPRISRDNMEWANTVHVAENLDGFGFDRNAVFAVTKSHPGLLDLFIHKARHEYLLSLPLKHEDIKREAAHILEQFQTAQEPNSPNGTHYMAQISPDFLARANSKDTDRLMFMLPFRSLSFSTLKGRTGTYALIRADENRSKKLCLRKPSVRKKLQEQTIVPKPSGKARHKEQEAR